MDGSLADYAGALLRDLREMASPNDPEITEANLWKVEEEYPHIAARMRVIKSQPGWWRKLSPIEDGFDVFSICRQLGFDMQILTKGPKRHSAAWTEKLEWCQHYIGLDAKVTVTFDKSMIYGKILYDDFPEYVESWLKWRPRGLAIMPVTPANEGHEIFNHPNVVAYRGRADVDKTFQVIQQAMERKHKEPLTFRS